MTDTKDDHPKDGENESHGIDDNDGSTTVAAHAADFLSRPSLLDHPVLR